MRGGQLGHVSVVKNALTALPEKLSSQHPQGAARKSLWLQLQGIWLPLQAPKGTSTAITYPCWLRALCLVPVLPSPIPVDWQLSAQFHSPFFIVSFHSWCFQVYFFLYFGYYFSCQGCSWWGFSPTRVSRGLCLLLQRYLPICVHRCSSHNRVNNPDVHC